MRDFSRISHMSSTDDLVIQTEHLWPAAAAWLAERCQLVACSHDSAEFRTLLAKARGLVVRTYTIVNEALLDLAPQLRVVGRAGVGLDNIDVSACRRRGIEVVYTPDANTQAVVEFVICLMCDALRPRTVVDRAVDASEWNRLRAETVASRQMSELTVGILGLGRVGKRVAKVASAIGCQVLYHDILNIDPEQRSGAAPVADEFLFEHSDVITVHIDGRASNRHFVNDRLLRHMKADALFINTSRGFVVDNLSLARFLTDHPQARAMLDVHDPEPFGPEYPLLGLPNATLFPHLASRTETAMQNMSWVVRDVAAVLEGRAPTFPAP